MFGKRKFDDGFRTSARFRIRPHFSVVVIADDGVCGWSVHQKMSLGRSNFSSRWTALRLVPPRRIA